jgi:LuxR family transcriptional regulator, maltose regulon positive regulatory protein
VDVLQQVETLIEPSSPSLLETKLRPPSARPQAVARSRLFERLDAADGGNLTLVAAPAGYGKTTLLGMWREIEADRRPVAWLTLDSGDDDPLVFWTYVLEALSRASVPVDPSLAPEQIGRTRIVDVLLPHIVNRLADHGACALVLDDFHRLSSAPVRDSVNWFIEHAPSTFQLVVSSRSEPALAVAALRAHGKLVELRAGDLRFKLDEAEAFMNHCLEIDLTREEIDLLVERTEGWPAGLYLAALSLEGAQDRPAFVSSYGGANRFVVDFLVDEVLDAYDPPTQALMLRSSILEGICGRLCDAVLDEDGSGARLAELARTNLFLVPLDDRGEWYRFHHLFAELLRVELEYREPGSAQDLHRRAYAWHRDHGSRDDAIEHALCAGAFDEAAELITAVWPDYLKARKHTTVLAWLERFPADVLREHQQLLLVRAWMSSACARREDAETAIDAVERIEQPTPGPLPDGFSSIEASVATLRGTIPWDDVGKGLENARLASELEGPESAWWPTICGALGLSLYFGGETDDADRWFVQAAEAAAASRHWTGGVSALAYRSIIAGEQGRHDEQELLADQAVELAQERGVEDPHGEVSIAAGLSIAASESLEEALPLLERGVFELRSLGQPIELAYALICHASVLRTVGDKAALADTIAEARAIVDSCADPGVLCDRLTSLERPQKTRQTTGESELTRRELIILRMLSGSLSERDIGRELYLSHNTIHSHTRSIYRKLAVSSRSEAVSCGRTLRLI